MVFPATIIQDSSFFKDCCGEWALPPTGLLSSLRVQLQRCEQAMEDGMSQEMGLRVLREHCRLGVEGYLSPIPTFD